VQVPPELQDEVDVEARAWIEFDGDGRVIAWGLED
jgi:hypothetical protein